MSILKQIQERRRRLNEAKRPLPAPERVKVPAAKEYASGQHEKHVEIANRASKVVDRVYEKPSTKAGSAFTNKNNFIKATREKNAHWKLHKAVHRQIADKEVARGRLKLKEEIQSHLLYIETDPET